MKEFFLLERDTKNVEELVLISAKEVRSLALNMGGGVWIGTQGSPMRGIESLFKRKLKKIGEEEAAMILMGADREILDRLSERLADSH